jgi:hypothetical protein
MHTLSKAKSAKQGDKTLDKKERKNYDIDNKDKRGGRK